MLNRRATSAYFFHRNIARLERAPGRGNMAALERNRWAPAMQDCHSEECVRLCAICMPDLSNEPRRWRNKSEEREQTWCSSKDVYDKYGQRKVNTFYLESTKACIGEKLFKCMFFCFVTGNDGGNVFVSKSNVGTYAVKFFHFRFWMFQVSKFPNATTAGLEFANSAVLCNAYERHCYGTPVMVLRKFLAIDW